MKTNLTILGGLFLAANSICVGQNLGRQSAISYRQQTEQQNRQSVSHLPKHAQEAALRSANTVSRPGKEEKYQWDTTAWEHTGTYTYTYNGAGNVAVTLITDPGSSQPSQRITCTYNAANLLTQSLEEYWDNTQWVASFRTVNTYDAAGNLLLSEDQYQGMSGWETTGGEKYTYTSNPAGHITEQVMEEYFNGGWRNREKNEYVRAANGEYTQFTYSTFDSITWQPQQRQTDIIWEDYAAGRMEKYISQGWDSTTWVNEERYTYVYGTNGSSVGTVEMFAGPGMWMEMAKIYTDYDSHSNFAGFKYELTLGGNVSTLFEHKHLITYDAQGNMTENIRQVSDFNNQTLTNELRSVFSDFGNISTGAENPVLAGTVSAWPNPATDRLQLTATDNLQSVQLFDVTGRQVYSKPAAGTSATIEMQQLQAGIYFLRAQTDKGFSEHKIVKQ